MNERIDSVENSLAAPAWQKPYEPEPPQIGDVDLIRLIGVEISQFIAEDSFEGMKNNPDPDERQFLRNRPKARCVLATALGVMIYEHFGFKVEAMPMDLEATAEGPEYFNEAMSQRIAERNQSARASGAGWDAHIVPIVNGMIVDSTAAQAADPSRGMFTADVIITPAPDVQKGELAEFRYATPIANTGEVTTVLRYSPRPEVDYDLGGLWKDNALAYHANWMILNVELATSSKLHKTNKILAEYVERPTAAQKPGAGRFNSDSLNTSQRKRIPR